MKDGKVPFLEPGKHFILAVHDRQLDAYMTPFTSPTIGVAVRSFTEEVNRQGSDLNKHPHDYELHVLGTFDPDTGRIERFNDEPTQVAIAANVLHSKRQIEESFKTGR